MLPVLEVHEFDFMLNFNVFSESIRVNVVQIHSFQKFGGDNLFVASENRVHVL